MKESLVSSLNYILTRITRKYAILGMLGLVTVLSWIAVYTSAKTGELEVYFFDVGQGDAIFLNFPDGRQILIDGGPNDKVVEKLSSVMPFWDRSIDIMIATHADADHITGLVPAFAHYEVGTVIWNGVPAETKIFEKWTEAVSAEGAEVLVGEYGTRIWLSEISFLEILYPFNSSGSLTSPEGLLGTSDPDELKQNDLSIVFRLVYGNDSFLFTGDIERGVEYNIISNGILLESDVLKIPHHGSKTSSSELFLQKIHPKIAVISVGRNNSYGHPYESILQRLGKYGIDVRRTDLEGDVILRSDGDNF